MGIIVLIYVGAVRVNMGKSDSGGSSGSCQLYVADSCGACETGESDHYGDESGCMRKTDRSCVGNKTGNAVGKFVVYRSKKRIPAVEFSNVSLTYKNAGAPSLSNISFRAMPGETIGIIGGTGAGKSSIVNMIPRFYDASEGEVKVFGHDVREYEIESLRSHIGVVPQKGGAF